MGCLSETKTLQLLMSRSRGIWTLSSSDFKQSILHRHENRTVRSTNCSAASQNNTFSAVTEALFATTTKNWIERFFEKFRKTGNENYCCLKAQASPNSLAALLYKIASLSASERLSLRNRSSSSLCLHIG